MACAEGVSVRFLPSGREVAAETGRTVLGLAHGAGIEITATCGARGRCTSCRIKLVEGRLTPPQAAEFSQLGPEQVSEGFRLACQAEVADRTVVLVCPPLTETAFQILTATSEEWSEPLAHGLEKAHLKVDLSADETDQVSDVERLGEALGEPAAVPLRLLRELPRLLRADEGSVTVTRSGRKLLAVEAGRADLGLYGIAFDIGTTSVVSYLVDLGTGRTVGTLSSLNPQATFGADLMSRIAYAQTEAAGARQLRARILGLLNQQVRELAAEAGIHPGQIHRAAVVGNSCMHHIALGINPESLGVAPYAPVVRDERECSALELGLRINPEASVIFLPLVAGFVGADTVGAVLSTRLAESDEPRCMVDIGTNGEVVLGSRRGLWACSAPAGPAFEGGQVSCGMRAAQGAIHRVFWRDGDLGIETIGGTPALGICGSGLLDLVALLLDHGVVDSSGRLHLDLPAAPETLRARLRVEHGERQVVVARGRETATGREIWLSQRDIRQVQLAKGAIASGIAALKRATGIRDHDIRELFLAGGFGNYLDVRSARRIGLIPPLSLERVRYVGNAAGDGARRVLLSERARARATAVARSIQHVSLATFPDFQEIFAEAVTFPAADGVEAGSG